MALVGAAQLCVRPVPLPPGERGVQGGGGVSLGQDEPVVVGGLRSGAGEPQVFDQYGEEVGDRQTGTQEAPAGPAYSADRGEPQAQGADPDAVPALRVVEVADVVRGISHRPARPVRRR